MIDFNSTSAFTNVYLGSNELSGVYVGGNKIWPETTPPPSPTGYSDQYLTFLVEESGTFRFSGSSVQYSLDSGTTWVPLANNTATPTLQSGDKIMWKATITPSLSTGIGTFGYQSNAFSVEGNPMSLLYGDNFVGVTDLTGKKGAFIELFRNASGLTSAWNMSIPSTNIPQQACFAMFQNCVNMTLPPAILPATSLGYDCYAKMFQGCTSLRSAPELPAETLGSQSYRMMFYLCSSLNYVKCLAKNIYETSQYGQKLYNNEDWLYGVAATGTFVKAATMTEWPTGQTGIPSGWTVEDAT